MFSLLCRCDWVWKLTSLAGLTGACTAGCAIAVLMRPGCVKRLGWLSLSLSGFVAVELPEVPNHRLVLAFVSLAFVFSLGVDRRSDNREETTWNAFFPAARWTAILVYAFAFFSKLNADFLNPDHSCSIAFYGNIRDTLGGWLPANDGVHSAIIRITLIVEGALPFLLLWGRTRAIAVLLGLTFHVALGLDVVKLFSNFSAVMSALLVLFLPTTFFDSWSTGKRKLFGRIPTNGPELSKICVAVFTLLIAFAILVGQFPALFFAYKWALFVTWCVVAVVLLTAVIPSFFMTQTPERALRLRAWPAFAVALVMLNGLSPWLGLKTRTAFNMYSNLRVEAGYSNHFLLPNGGLDLLGHLEDTVRIIGSSDRDLHETHAESGLNATYFSLGQTAAARGPVIEIVYERDGRRFQYFPGRNDPEPLKIPPWILRKLLLYRPIGDGVERQCIW
ncbi:MAG: HTTM domain-containing protein [Verrucomicrobiota bacterium]